MTFPLSVYYSYNLSFWIFFFFLNITSRRQGSQAVVAINYKIRKTLNPIETPVKKAIRSPSAIWCEYLKFFFIGLNNSATFCEELVFLSFYDIKTNFIFKTRIFWSKWFFSSSTIIQFATIEKKAQRKCFTPKKKNLYIQVPNS